MKTDSDSELDALKERMRDDPDYHLMPPTWLQALLLTLTIIGVILIVCYPEEALSLFWDRPGRWP